MAALITPHYSPLLVRSPSLNAWIPPQGDNSGPVYWTKDNESLGLTGLIRIDNTTFSWLGNPDHIDVKRTDFLQQTMTPTSTIQTFETDQVNLTVTYLSPVEDADVVRQSFPFSYVSVNVIPNDGRQHDVQVYMDMEGEWLSYNQSTVITSSAHPGDKIVYLEASPANIANISMEVSDRRADDVTLYLGMPSGNSTTYRTGEGDPSRNIFLTEGKLDDARFSNDLPIRNESTWFGLSVSKDLGAITPDVSGDALFAIGLVRDPSISFTPSPGGTAELRKPCFRTAFDDVGAALSDFLGNFSAAKKRATTFDEKIVSAAKEISNDVADLVTLTTRLVMASMDVTCGSSSDDVMFFVNGMGSLHESGTEASYANRVEDLYAAWPAIMTINSTYGRYILEPLLRFQVNLDSVFALPDLGNTYPIVNGGNPNSEVARNLAVEDSSNMLLMVWAQARFSDESNLVNNYYDLLKTWADQLADGIPKPYSTGLLKSADGDGSSSTNLALKGILGIRAMAELARLKDDIAAADAYFTEAGQLYANWAQNAIIDDHLLLNYGTNDSWGLMYNLYPDKWLGLNLVAQDIYDRQDEWYKSKLSNAMYGVPYNTSNKEVKSQWSSFTAATMGDAFEPTRDLLMKTIKNYALNPDTGFLQSTYSLDSGNPSRATGAIGVEQGSMFALQALHLTPLYTAKYGGSSSSGSRSKSSKVGAIVGGVAGGAGASVLALILCLLWWRRRRQSLIDGGDLDSQPSPNQWGFISPFIPSPTDSQLGSPGNRETRKSGLDSNITPPATVAPTPSSQYDQWTPSTVNSTSAQPNRDSTPEFQAQVVELQHNVQHLLNRIHLELPPPGYEISQLSTRETV